MTHQLKLKFTLGLAVLFSSLIVKIPAQGKETLSLLPEKSSNQVSAQLVAQTPESSYNKAKSELSENWYVMYRITEKLIRANGLTDKPWRVAFLPDPDINAFAKDVNLIAVHGGLVDQVFGDTSALACVIGHEIAHHTQRHIPIRMATTVEEVKTLEKELIATERNARVTSTVVEGTTSIVGGSGLGGLFGGIIRSSAKSRQKRKIKAFNERQMQRSHANELESDEEGLKFISKAGFDPQGCVRVLTVIANTPGGGIDSDTHPNAESRVEKMKALIASLPKAELKAQGDKNLSANPKPLGYGKSADGQSLRLNSKFGDKWEF